MSEINMVPFIDIMMVMLVAFMVSAPIMNQSINVDLPKASSEPLEVPKDQKPIVISLKKDGSYYLNLDSTKNNPLSLNKIIDLVTKVKKAKPATLILLEGDKDVNYGRVIAVMSDLQKQGISNVGLLTDPDE